MKSKFILSAFTAIFISLLAMGTIFAQSGNLDISFDTDGILTQDISANGLDVAYGIAEQADGKIVLAGYTVDGGNANALVTRMNSDGSPDLSFDADGKAIFDLALGGADRLTDVHIQADGKIICAGYTDNGNDNDVILIRLLADGSYDNTFGTGGKIQTDFGQGEDDLAYAMALQDDGRIVIAGRMDYNSSSNLLVARYTSAGVLDTSFDLFGSVTFDPSNGGEDGLFDVEIAPDGKIVATGYSEWGVGNQNMIIARLDAAGQPDQTFSSDGFFAADLATGADEYGYALKVMSNGGVLVAGSSKLNGNTDASLVKVKSSGLLDNSFNSDGIAYYDFTIGGLDVFRKLEIQQDGMIIAGGHLDKAGTGRDFLVAKMNSNGDLDGSFGTSGWATTDLGSSASDNMRSMCLMSNGKIMVGGYSSGKVAVVRFTNDNPVGTLSTNNIEGEIKAWPQPFNAVLHIQIPNTLENEAVLEIYGLDGQLKYRQAISATEAGSKIDLSRETQELSAGLYILKLQSETSSWSHKLLKH